MNGEPPALDHQKLAAARVAASTGAPYLASALFALPVRAEPGSGTIAVDRWWRVAADPVVVDTLDAPTLGSLLLHLLGHVLRDHSGRAAAAGVGEGGGTVGVAGGTVGVAGGTVGGGGGTVGVAGGGGDGRRWNRCADAEVNDDLAPAGLLPAPAPTLPADLGCRPGGLVEEYFAAAGPGERVWDCGSGADGQRRPWDGGPAGSAPPDDGLGPGDTELLRLGVAAAIQRQGGQQPGTVGGGWLRWAEEVLPSRTDWRAALAAAVRVGVASVAGAVDYSYRRPSRRAVAVPGVVLPSLHRPVPDVAIVCDTSGSMTEALLGRVLVEVEAILRRAGLRAAQVRVLAVDAAVHAVRRVSSASQVTLAGGGGTDMGQGIAAAAALRPPPSVIVVLTDGYTPWPPAPPPRTTVVVGILRERRPGGGGWPGRAGPEVGAPAWAKVVVIEP